MKAICAALSFLIAWCDLATNHTHYAMTLTPTVTTTPRQP